MYLKKTKSNFSIGTFYLTGEPISPHLLRYNGFAVKDAFLLLVTKNYLKAYV
jgi:hypothetical protein